MTLVKVVYYEGVEVSIGGPRNVNGHFQASNDHFGDRNLETQTVGMAAKTFHPQEVSDDPQEEDVRVL